MLSSFFNRGTGRSLLIEVNPYQILAAGLSRLDEGGLQLDCIGEFELNDQDGLRRWLDVNFEERKNWLPALTSFVPPDGLLARDSILPRKLIDPAYLADLVREQHRIENPAAWMIRPLSPLEGEPIAPEGTQRPALLCGVSHSDVHRIQQRLLDHRLLPYRLELGLLPLFGAISHYKTQQGDKRATVVVVIEQDHTQAYIIGKEGVQTPAPVPHGFASIVQAARKEFDLHDAESIRARLHLVDEELLLRATKFVRAIGRDLKPICDSYELTTGQPIGELHCAYLPAGLAWIAEPLNLVVGRIPFTMDVSNWMSTVGLQTASGIPRLGHNWLGALSLAANIPGSLPEKTTGADPGAQAAWHGDWRLSADLPSNDLVRSRFVANLVAVVLASAALMFTIWQAYSGYVLHEEIEYWEVQIAENQRAFTEVTQLNARLGEQNTRFYAAFELMVMPYQVSDLVLDLARTRPAVIQLETIASIELGFTLGGTLRESSQQASRTLRNYVESLKQDPALGPRFSSIALTSIERDPSGQSLTFEIVFRQKPPEL